jgi:hypothetical protein
MVHVSLQLYFLYDLILHFRLLYLGLVHYLYRVHKSSLFLLCDVNITEPATSQFFTQLKLVYLDILEVKLRAFRLFLNFVNLFSHSNLLEHLKFVIVDFLVYSCLTDGFCKQFGELN